MLKTVGAPSLAVLLKETIPDNVYDPQAMSEPVGKHPLVSDLLHEQFKRMLDQNKQFTSFIGEGFYGTIVPPVIERNFLSNPGWYTAYTPYHRADSRVWPSSRR